MSYLVKPLGPPFLGLFGPLQVLYWWPTSAMWSTSWNNTYRYVVSSKTLFKCMGGPYNDTKWRLDSFGIPLVQLELFSV